ncbi:kinase-like domain-containing protein [Mycena olivaceomarginata]|nr:kinase-like domain-containing protein [Mycena olivaceomarginata]
MSGGLLRAFDNFKDQTKDAIWALSSCLCQQSAKVKINGRTFKINKVLGEGGFSFVYLAQDEHSGEDISQRQFALKKIRCPTVPHQTSNIIRILDSAVVQDPDGDGKNCYSVATFKTAINANVVNGTHFPEQEMVRLFKGTCEAIRAMHTYRAPVGATLPKGGNAGPRATARAGYSYDNASVPLEEGDTAAHTGATELVPYAHRDLKPGNIMIADDGSPIVMDFGSTIKARVEIANRSQALVQQDIAAEQSTMAYRAPELYDVKTDTTLDEKVDIWITEQGGSIAMAVLNAQYKHPANSAYSQGFKELVDSMLKVDPKDRPDVHKVIEMTDRVLQSLA